MADEFAEVNMGTGDERLAVLPWLHQGNKPTSYKLNPSRDVQAP